MTVISAFAAVWLLLSGAGLTVTAGNLIDAARDLRGVHELPGFRVGGPRHVLARGHFRREALRLTGHGVFFLAGVLALLPPNPARRRRDWASTALLILAQSVYLVNGVADRYDRARIRAMPGYGRRKSDRVTNGDGGLQ